MAESASRGRIVRVLQILFALALFAFVFSRVPWGDRVLIGVAPEEELAIPGTIEGPWEGDSIVFRVAENLTADLNWPESLQGAQASGRSVPLSKSEALDWRPGLGTVLRGLRASTLALAIAITLLAQGIVVTRWWLLLSIGRCGTRWIEAFRLTFLGLFFNLVVPGVTGGDLVKTVLAVRDHPERRMAAFVSIAVDRILGMFGLTILASLAVAWVAHSSESEAARKVALQFRPFVFSATAAVAVALFVWLLAPPFLERIARALPGGKQLASIVHSGREHRAHPAFLTFGVILSVLNHLANASVVFVLAQSLGCLLTWPEVMSATAIGSAAATIPLSPGGLGVLEGAIGYLFEALGSTLTLGVATALSWRLLLVLLGLLGGLFLLLPGGRRTRAEALAAAAAAN